MEELLQIQIEFVESQAQGEITKEAMATTIKEVFLEMGIESSVVQAGVDKGIDIHKESSLSIDPGTAALVIATIGVGLDLIKIAVDLYKQHVQQREESKKHQQDIELGLAKLQLDRERFEVEKQQRGVQGVDGKDNAKVNQEEVSDLLAYILTPRLIERYHIQSIEYRFDVMQRR